jgi:alpha-soluble NSF attachment protein
LKRALECYQDLDPSFNTTREFKFLQHLLVAVENGDVEQFTQYVIDYDHLTKLDPWKTSILLRIKKSINEEPTLT